MASVDPLPSQVLPSPDLRKLGHFVAVAEDLNFTIAANRLHIAQQALSASVRRLEQELGVQLFERSTRRVSLTDAGRLLLHEGRPLLASSRATWENVRRIARQEPQVVRIGHTPPVPPDQLDAFIVAWRIRHPDIRIVVTQHSLDDLTVRVADGTVDVGLCRVIEPGPDLRATTLGQRPLRVAMSVDHRLAELPFVDLTDLAGEEILEAEPAGRVAAQHRAFLVQLCHDAGFEPTMVSAPVRGVPPVAAVAGTPYVAIVDAPAGSVAGGAVIVRDLLSAPTMPIRALTRVSPVAAAVEEFVAGATEAMLPPLAVAA